MNKHEVSFDVKNTLKGLNASGQAIGGGQFSWESGKSTPVWFFDSSIDYQDVGSFDKLKRWPVQPIMITKSGYVIGDGDKWRLVNTINNNTIVGHSETRFSSKAFL